VHRLWVPKFHSGKGYTVAIITSGTKCINLRVPKFHSGTEQEPCASSLGS
jgi:hypothetical protein